MEEFEGNGSGLISDGLQKMVINVYKVHDIQASSYIPLPKKYHDSKSILNIQNNDNYCFLYSVLAHFIKPLYHRERASWYTPYFQNLNIDGLVFPMQVKDIPKFERQNTIHKNPNILYNLNINVFELVAGILIPKHIKKIILNHK